MIIDVNGRTNNYDGILEIVQSYLDNWPSMSIKVQNVNTEKYYLLLNNQVESWIKINVSARQYGSDPTDYSSILSSVEDSIKANYSINVLLIPTL